MSDVLIRLADARKKLKILVEDVKKYLQDSSPTTRIESNDYEDMHFFVLNAEPPPELALLVGELIANLRSAIEYRLREIAVNLKNDALTGKEANKIQMRFYASETKFEKSIVRTKLARNAPFYGK